MKPVQMVHARAQSDAPVWDDANKMFTSRFGGDTFDAKFRGAMDTVNTASVEGGLMYVQAECIDYRTRSAEAKCERKNGVQYMVFYHIVMAQTNETLAQYGENVDQYSGEYGPMIPMDGGRCTPSKAEEGKPEEFPVECMYFNGTNGEPQIGPFVGGEDKSTDDRAPYPGNWWFSFPNTCPLEGWGSKKSDECRASTRRGLCEPNMMPNGVDCTYNYRILGYLPIDDLVGITAMTDANDQPYANFSTFCKDDKVEFKTFENGTVEQSIEFWVDPSNATANELRTQKMIDMYHKLVDGSMTSKLVPDGLNQHMTKLPTVEELTSKNPKCFENVGKCSTGCHRSKYSQLCSTCDATKQGCEKATEGFTFPTLEKAKGEGGKTASPTVAPTESPSPTPTTTTAPPSSGASVVSSFGALAASIVSTMALLTNSQ